MTVTQKDIDSYAIEYVSQKDSAGKDSPVANIRCFYGPDHQEIARILFFDVNSLPPNGIDYNSNLLFIYFHISLFHDVMEVLRYDKPLQINFDDSNLAGWISNREFEPIGQYEKSQGNK